MADLPKKIIVQTGLENHTIINLSDVEWGEHFCELWEKDKELAIEGIKLILKYGVIDQEIINRITSEVQQNDCI